MKSLTLFLTSSLVLTGCATTGIQTSDGIATSAAHSAFLAKTDDPKMIKGYFCTGQKARMKLKTNIKAVMPSFNGLALDKAAEQKMQIHQFYGQQARAFYALGSLPVKLYSVSDEDPEVYTKAIRSHKLDATRDSFRFVNFPKQNLVYIVPDAVFHEIEDGIMNKYGGSQKTHSENYTTQREGSVLSQKFSLLGPDGLLVKGKQVSISDAVERREDAWKAYFVNFTAVKEAPDRANPDDARFEAALDLDNFCKYGKALDELKAQ